MSCPFPRAILTLLVLGCTSATEPTGRSGHYELDSVDGVPVPAELFSRFGYADGEVVVSGSIDITGDSAVLRESRDYGTPDNPAVTELVGRYAVVGMGDTITLVPPPIPDAYPQPASIRLIVGSGMLTRPQLVGLNSYEYIVPFVYRRK